MVGTPRASPTHARIAADWHMLLKAVKAAAYLPFIIRGVSCFWLLRMQPRTRMLGSLSYVNIAGMVRRHVARFRGRGTVACVSTTAPAAAPDAGVRARTHAAAVLGCTWPLYVCTPIAIDGNSAYIQHALTALTAHLEFSGHLHPYASALWHRQLTSSRTDVQGQAIDSSSFARTCMAPAALSFRPFIMTSTLDCETSVHDNACTAHTR